MSNDVKIKLSLTENVSKQLRGVSAEFDKLGGKGSGASLFGNIGAKAVAKGFDLIAGAADNVVGFLEDSVQQAMDAQVSQAALARALENNVKYWDHNTQAIEDRIDAGLRLGFTDDMQRESMVKLITATGSVDTSFKMLAIAMDVARFKNISLTDASVLLIKATHGNLRALKELGIQMPKNATAAEILTAINDKLKGSAEDYANTLSGKVEAAQARLQNAQEKLGGYVTPALTFAFNGLAGILDYLSGKPSAKATGALKAIEDQVNAVKHAVDNVLISWNRLMSAITAGQMVINAASHVDLGNIIPHAKGGWVGRNGPELGLLGEGGAPEYVSRHPISGGGTGVRIVGVSERELTDMVERGLYFRLQRAGTAS